MGKRSTPLLIGALAIVGSLVVGPAATAEPGAHVRRNGRVHSRPGAAQPPGLWLDNNLLATGLVLNNIWYGGQIHDNNANCVQPRLFDGQAEARQEEPADRSQLHSTRTQAVWSDGKPVTCEDWKATWQVFDQPAVNVVSRAGYGGHQVRHRATARQGTVVFKKPFADWETLVSSGVYAGARHRAART